jgi:hypothetical protein
LRDYIAAHEAPGAAAAGAERDGDGSAGGGGGGQLAKLTSAAGRLLTSDAPSVLTRRAFAQVEAERRRAIDSGTPHPAVVVPATKREYAGLLAAIGFKEFEEYWKIVEDEAAAAAASSSSSSSSAAAASSSAPPARDTAADAAAAAAVAIGAKSSAAAAAAGRKRGRKEADPAADALVTAVARLCEVTHQYARKQDRWIRNRFHKRGVPMTALDTSCVAAAAGAGGSADADGGWGRLVARPAIDEVKAWLARPPSPVRDVAAYADIDGSSSDGDVPEGRVGSAPPALVPAAPEAGRIAAWRQHTCDVCGGKLLNGDHALELHVASKAHRKKAAWKARNEAAAAEMRRHASEAAGAGASGGAEGE